LIPKYRPKGLNQRLIIWALTKNIRIAAGIGYHSSPNLVYLFESGTGVTSAQVMLGGNQMASFQNMLDKLMLFMVFV